MELLIDLVISFLIVMILDIIWLGLIMNNYYSNLIANIQGVEINANFFAAGLCYATLIFGLNYFVLSKTKKYDLLNILSLSVPYGLVTYGTYDFTSAAVLKNFDLITAFIDVTWGMLLMSLAAIGTVYSRRYFDIIKKEKH